MPKLGADQLALIVVVVVGATVAFVTRYSWVSLSAAAPVVVALVVIWGLAATAVMRVSGRAAWLSIPALAILVLSIATLAVVQLQHPHMRPYALGFAALSIVLVRAAIRFDLRPRP